jgi:hypothetical protein
MPSVVIPFTIYSGGVEKSLAGWGLDDLQFSDNDLAPSTVEFTVAGRAVDATDLFAYGSRVTIFQNRNFDGANYSGGSCWFDGRVEPWERNGTNGSEDCIGRLVNAWWYFERLQYKMQFIRTYAAGATVTYTTNRVVLGVSINATGTGWVVLNTGQQIAAAVNWAISQGAPVQLGAMAPWAPVISDFQKCIKVSQVIQKMWQIESDFVALWDYSTVGNNPAALGTPTIHFKKCSAANCNPAVSASGLTLTPLTINLDAGNWLSKFKIKPRPDWIKSYVFINYDQINTFGNESFLSIGSDQWPAVLPADTESKFNGVDLYYDLAGYKQTPQNQSGHITSAPFDITNLATWQKWKSELLAPTVASSVIVGAATTPAATTLHPAPTLVTKEVDASGNPVAYNNYNLYELLDGNWADWMADPLAMASANMPTISAQKVKATAWVFITFSNGTKTYKQITKEFTAISYNTAFADLTINTQTVTTTQYSEVQPVGLAKIMYNAWRSLAVEGIFSTLETEIGATNPQVTRANCLNFTSAGVAPFAGGGTIMDWSAVNAPVRRVSGSAVKGTCTVEFGAPLHLTANALVDLVRASRVRVTSVNLAYLFGGQLNDGVSTIKHVRKTHAHAAEHGADEPACHVVAGPDAIDPTRTQVIKSDSSTGLVTVLQQPTAGGAAYTTGLIAPEFSGAGSPSATTLAASASYLIGCKYFDTTGNALWRCSGNGSNSTSTWVQIGSSGSGGTTFADFYTSASTYLAGSIVQVLTATTIGSGANAVTIQPGTYVLRQGLTTVGGTPGVTAGVTTNMIPQYPYPVTPDTNGVTIYWMCISLGISVANVCASGSQQIYINASGSF